MAVSLNRGVAVARPHKPWYRAPRQTWFVEVEGKQVVLAKGPKAATQKEAWEAFNKLMERVDAPDPNAQLNTVASLFGRFLGWTKKKKAPATYDQRKAFLKSFVKFKKVRTMRPERVTVQLVEDWLDAHPKWKNSRRHAILCVLSAFNWAVKRKLLSSNPATGIEIPSQGRVLTYLTKEQRKTIFEASKAQSFKDLLTALEQTGCRPGEASSVEAKHINLELGVWVLPKHKTAKKTGKPRTVYLNPAMLELSRTLMAKNPEGPIFRNHRKKPWNRNAIRCRFRVLRKRFPEFGHFTSYSYRRAFITDALVNGVEIAKVAELVGTSINMVMRHYSQLQERTAHMREMASKATG
jgi:integrase